MDELEPVAGPSQSASRSVNIQKLDLIDVDNLDWKLYEGTYKGRALITRLIHIPNLILNSPTPTSTSPTALSLARSALTRLLPLIRSSTWDHTFYLRVISQIDSALHPEKLAGDGEPMDGVKGTEEAGVADMEWVEDARENERRESARLDVELRGYMSNLIKESIRLTYVAFAQLAVKCGSAQSAMKNLSASREYSSSPQHHVELGLGILATCLSYNQLTSLPGHISKLEAALDRVHPPPITGANRQNGAENANLTAGDLRETREREERSAAVRKTVGVQIRVGKGLVTLAAREYEKAGREFGEISEEGGLGEWEGQVEAISTADIAIMTVLCVLATGSRDRIRRVLLDRTSFRASVDDSQAWLLDLVRAFMDAKYGDASTILRTAEPMLLLNPFLSAHVQSLIDLIQTRSVVQYVAPFSSVRIEVMAQAFAVGIEEMSRQVEKLVEEKRVLGKIDLIDLVLVMKAPDPRAELYANAMKVGRETSDMTRAALLHMRLHEAGISVHPRPSGTRSLGLGPTDSLQLDEEVNGNEPFGLGREDLPAMSRVFAQ